MYIYSLRNVERRPVLCFFKRIEGGLFYYDRRPLKVEYDCVIKSNQGLNQARCHDQRIKPPYTTGAGIGWLFVRIRHRDPGISFHLSVATMEVAAMAAAFVTSNSSLICTEIPTK